MQSPYVYRSFRAIVVGEDGTHILITTISGLRFVEDADPETMTAELFNENWPWAKVGRTESGMKEEWESLGLQSDETLWIGLPDREGPYHYAFLVP